VGGVLVRHVGLVSDRWAHGAPMVIHRSKARQLAVEEPWEAFANGPVYLERHPPAGLRPSLVLARARAMIGSEWRMLTQNCEHFVALARGEQVRSGQVRSHAAAAVVALGAGFAAVHALAGPRG